MDAFEKEFPDRFFQVGVVEANMMGLAAGMTVGGRSITGTFAISRPGRVYDQIVSRSRIPVRTSRSALPRRHYARRRRATQIGIPGDIGMTRIPGIRWSSAPAISTKPNRTPRYCRL